MKRPSFWLIMSLILVSAMLLLNFDHVSEKEEELQDFTPPHAPKKDYRLKASPSKLEDQNSNQERETIKPLS